MIENGAKPLAWRMSAAREGASAHSRHPAIGSRFVGQAHAEMSICQQLYSCLHGNPWESANKLFKGRTFICMG